jgi:4-amino-4-deoxy-L-arabinose transferase-like glycosyltransferase
MATEARPAPAGKSKTQAGGHLAALLIALLFVAVMLPIGAQGLIGYPDERHYAYAGARMIKGGDWIVPRTPDGEVRLKKPILPYWMSAAGFEIAGVGKLGQRLLWVVGAGLVLLATYGLALTAGLSIGAALLAEAMLASNPVFLRAAITAIPDLPLALFMTLATIGFVRILTAPAGAKLGKAAWLAWISTALAILSKGILPLVFAAFVVAYGFAFDRRRLAPLLAPAALAAALVVAGAWYAAVVALFPTEFVDQFFRDQVTTRLSDRTSGPFLAFPGYVLTGLGSFLVWPLMLLALAVRDGRLFAISAWPRAAWLFALWSLVMAAIFSLGGSASQRYITPALPLLAVLLAMGVASIGDGLTAVARISRWLLLPASLAALLLFIAGALIQGQIAGTQQGLAYLAAGATVAIGAAFLGWRKPATASYLLSAMPAAWLAAAVVPALALTRPDTSEVLAAKLAAMDRPAADVLFVGGQDDASETRLRVGRADPFRHAKHLPAELGGTCVVLTMEGDVAETLRGRGFAVETLRTGWRTIDAGDLVKAVWTGTLAKAREANAGTAYVATCPRQGAADAGSNSRKSGSHFSVRNCGKRRKPGQILIRLNRGVP